MHGAVQHESMTSDLKNRITGSLSGNIEHRDQYSGRSAGRRYLPMAALDAAGTATMDHWYRLLRSISNNSKRNVGNRSWRGWCAAVFVGITTFSSMNQSIVLQSVRPFQSMHTIPANVHNRSRLSYQLVSGFRTWYVPRRHKPIHYQYRR